MTAPDYSMFPLKGHYSFIIHIKGFRLEVTYQSNPYNMTGDWCHFEFRGKTASPTGFKSHFMHMNEINTSPYGFALYAAGQLYAEVKSRCPDQLRTQLDLFS